MIFLKFDHEDYANENERADNFINHDLPVKGEARNSVPVITIGIFVNHGVLLWTESGDELTPVPVDGGRYDVSIKVWSLKLWIYLWTFQSKLFSPKRCKKIVYLT